MPNQYDYKKFAILYVDDEEKSLVNFTRAFSDDFTILTANSAVAAYEIVQKQAAQIGVLMTDQRMPGEKGVWLLERVRLLRPQIKRIIVTAYTDMEWPSPPSTAAPSINTSPSLWDPAQLELMLKQSLSFSLVEDERDQLLREKMSVWRNMLIAALSALGLLVVIT